MEIIIPIIGLPHPELPVKRIRSWCMPLKTGEENDDIIAMAQLIQEDIEMEAEANLKISLREELDANDDIFRTVRAEALRF